MSLQLCGKKFVFKVGDLVKYVRIESLNNIPKHWSRISGTGIVTSKRKTENMSSIIYTVLSSDRLFECLEVYPVTTCIDKLDAYEVE